jgi:pre-60S factor REI1
VASLPPLSSEIFAEKVLSAQANSSAAAAKASFEKSCLACQRTYYSENAYQNHLGSQKHKAREAAFKNGPAEDEMTSVMSSTVSLGDPLDASSLEVHDPAAEAELSTVVKKIKDTSLDENVPIIRHPSQPHHSVNEVKSEHPLSQTSTSTSMPATELEASSGEINLKQCLFCNYESPSLKLSVMHMTKFHGMFIPEQSYLVNLEGLIRYLQSKVVEDHECLFCHKLKSSKSGIQTHMRDTGHCMIAFDSDEEMVEIGQYFDFRSTYSDDGCEDSDMSDEKHTVGAGAKLSAKRAAFDSTNDSSMPDADGWETDSSASSLDSADLTAVPIDHDHAYERLAHHRHHTHSDPRPHRNPDGFHSHAHSHHAAFHSDHELHLPSGRTAGHRSLNRYYRQNLYSHPSPAERAEQRLLAESAAEGGEEEQAGRRSRQLTTRANGGTGMIGVSDAKKKEVTAVEKREQKRAHRLQQEYQWGNNKRANSQKHFRDPLLQ